MTARQLDRAPRVVRGLWESALRAHRVVGSRAARRCILLLAVAAAASAGEARQWMIHSDPGRDDVARIVADLMPRAQQELERRLGLALRGRASLVLCGSYAAFRQATPGMDHRHTLGVALPLEKIIYLNCEAIERQPLDNVAVTLRHEVSHILVGEVARRGFRRVPLWFDEGVAVWTSGKIPFYDTGDYGRAVAAGTLAALGDLADRFPLDPRERGIAYEQSESAIRYLVKCRGDEVVPATLQATARGVEFDEAFRLAAGMDIAAFEQDWLASVRPGWPWLSWLLNAVSLFSAMSVLALLSFWVYWRRRRRKYKEWDVEEQLEAGEGGAPW